MQSNSKGQGGGPARRRLIDEPASHRQGKQARLRLIAGALMMVELGVSLMRAAEQDQGPALDLREPGRPCIL
jgi:hypothetical protein